MTVNLKSLNDTCNIKTETIPETIENYNYVTKQNSNFIEVMMINIRSVNKNFNSLLVFLKTLERKPDVIVCSETWKLLCPNYFNVEGYNFYYNQSHINKADGVVVYVNSNLRSTTKIEDFGQAKFLSTEINNNSGKAIKISSIYIDVILSLKLNLFMT